MENKKPPAVWLRKDMADELVEPYKIEEVLKTLQEEAIIASFDVGPGFVKIQPTAGRRFDLAMYFAEETLSPDGSDRARKPPARAK